MATPDSTRRPRALAAVLALALAAWPASGRAQEGEDGEKVDVASLDLRSLLDPSVEAVALHEEPTSEASASVFVLSAGDIRRQGFRTLEEALRSVPGLFGYADGLYPMIGVRGMGLLGDHTTRMLVLVDGHPLNNSVGMGQSYLGRDLPVPMAAVRRIEVIKGPVGSVYGPTAFLGVVNVVTTGAASGFEASSAAEVAQGALRSGDAGVFGAGQAGGVSWLVSVDGYGTRGLDWTYPEYASASPPDPGGGRVQGKDSGNALQSYARASWRDLTISGSCGRWYTGIPSAPYSSLLRDDRNALENRTCFAQLGFSRALSSAFVLQARASYDDALYQGAFAYPPPPTGVGLLSDSSRDKWFSADVRGTWQPWSGTRLVAGAEGESHDTFQQAYSLSSIPGPGIGAGAIDKAFRTLNTYLLLEQAVGPTVTLHGGLTFYAHEIFGSRLTSKLAAVWQPTRGDTFKIIYSEGFRAPTVAEALFQDGVTYLANPALRPETVRSLELVYERRLGRVASLSASLFENTYRDLIGFVSVLPPGAPPPGLAQPSDYRETALNVQALRLWGGELGLRLSWRDLLEGWAGLSVQALDQPDRPNFPTVTTAFALSSRALWRPLTLSVNGSVISARAKDPTIPSPGAPGRVDAALTLNVFASLDVPGARGLALELGVQNLLDGQHLDPVPGDFAPLSQMAEPPRTVRAGLRYRF